MSVARRALQIVAFVATLIVGVASMAVIVTQTTWFKEWLRGFIVRQAEDYVNGRLSIGRLDGNLFFGVELEDVDVTMNGKTVVDIKDVGLDYSVLTFIRGDVVLDDIRLNQPVFHLERTADGWNLARLMKARTPDSTRRRRPIEIGEIGVSGGTLHIEPGPVGTSGNPVSRNGLAPFLDTPARIDDIDASVGVRSNEHELRIDLTHVSLRAAEPRIGINALSGVVVRTKDEIALQRVSLRTEESSLRVSGTIRGLESREPVLDLEASSDKLALDEIARVVPALRGYAMQPAFELTAKGPVDRLDVNFNVREGSMGRARGEVTVDTTSPRRVAGTASVERFNVGVLVRDSGSGSRDATGTTGGASEFRVPSPRSRLTSDITGDARFDLTLPGDGRPLRGTYSVSAPRVTVSDYQARNVVATGRIDGRLITLNARANGYGGRATAVGRVRAGSPLSLDLRGHAAGVDLRNLPASLRMPGAPSNLAFDYTLRGRGRTYSGDLRLDASTLAGATIANGTTARFRFGDGAPAYAATGHVTNLDVQEVGRAFDIRAITEDRFSSRITGTFDVSGSGGGRYPFSLDATGTLVDSEMFGASFPRLDFATRFAGPDAYIRTTGQVSGLDPAVAIGTGRVRGLLTGDVDAETRLRNYRAGVTVDSIDVQGRVALTNSRLNDVALDRAVVAGHYANREGELTTLDIAGPDMNVTGQGRIALNETGASNLTVHAETTSLERLRPLIGQPLKGSAIVDATITGNARGLKAAGTLAGSDVGYEEHEALTLNSQFEVSLPALDASRARVQAKSTATFLEVGGQTITELAADTTYVDKTLDFNATAHEQGRELQAAGRAVFHPDHQEVHLTGLQVRAEMVEWSTAPGSEATVQYGNDRIVLRNVQLVSGDQRIAADGVIGSETESLQVKAENVDVAQLDQLVFGDGRFAGRLTADATVSGPTSAPRVAGNFALANGAFRTFKFESLAGTVSSAPRGLNLDVRLQQTPTVWLTAEGYAPLSLFRANPPDISGHAEAPAGEAIDLRIASSQIDLGLVQGFTSYVTNVTGILQADVRVTGSGFDPHLDGTVDIRGGAFAIPDLGTAYTGLDTRIDLKSDLVTFTEFKILDSRGRPMTIGGNLSVHERAVGAVNVTVQSENFEVIDNRLADLKLDTQIRITGELRRPRVEGFVEVENGTIHLAELLEETARNPYAIEETELSGGDAAARAVIAEAKVDGDIEKPAEEGSLFDALELDLGLAIPSNLVIRGNDLQPANAPIDIGDINTTVGGAVQVRKGRGGRIRLAGEVNTVRGTYNFQGRRFEIMRDGRIRFDGSEEIDPAIDVRARRIISGVETFVRVHGTMRQPELAFSSNPPLDQADILSLIVFNQPVNELGEGQQASLAERAGALAGGYLASGLARSISDALELDEFEIQAGGEGGLGPSLTVGEQVGEHLFVRLRQAFGDAQATEFILEYQLKDYLRLQATAADTSRAERVTFRRVERGGIDLIFFFSY